MGVFEVLTEVTIKDSIFWNVRDSPLINLVVKQCQAEVEYLDFSLLVNKDVARFYIAVDDSNGVGMRECVC